MSYSNLTISIEIEMVRKGYFLVHEVQVGRASFLTEWSSLEDAEARAEFLRDLWRQRGATVA